MISRSTDIAGALRSRQRGFLLNPFRFGGGGGGFTPLDLPGIRGWWDASDASTRTMVSGLLSQLNDKSGSANHAFQPIPAERLALSPTSVNGLDALTSSGTGNLRITTNISPVDGVIYVFVVGGSTQGTTFVSGYNPEGSGFQPYYLWPDPDGNVYTRSNGLLTLSGIGAATSNGSINSMSLVGTGSVQTMTFNSRTVSGNIVANVAVSGLVGFGNITSYPGYLTGTLCEVIVGVGALTAPQIAAAKSYLKAKWGTP